MSESHRIAFKVQDDLFERFQAIPWGLRSSLMRLFVEYACGLHEKHGEMALAMLLSKDFRLTTDLEKKFLSASKR